MKNLLFLLFLFTIQNGFSQNFFRVGGSIFSEEKFNSFFKNIKKENYPNPVRFYVFETIKKNDSLIKNTVIITSSLNYDTKDEYYSLLNHPFPSFSFKDFKNVKYTNTFFLNKPTIVCLWKPKYFLPSRKEIKALNAINEEEQFNVVGFLLGDVNENSFSKKPNFPIFKNTDYWLRSNLPGHHVPQYLIINSKGVLSYLFLEFPDKKTPIKPMGKIHKEIFNKLTTAK
ncbi:MAG: TlpA family protein disulfide reductase [Flavobacteriaceae bacterium]